MFRGRGTTPSPRDVLQVGELQGPSQLSGSILYPSASCGEQVCAVSQAPAVGPPQRHRARGRHPQVDQRVEQGPQALRLDQIRRRHPGNPRRLLPTDHGLRTLGSLESPIPNSDNWQIKTYVVPLVSITRPSRAGSRHDAEFPPARRHDRLLCAQARSSRSVGDHHDRGGRQDRGAEQREPGNVS